MKTPHVLIIEDEEDIAELLVLHLQDMGIEITVAHSGEQGLQACEQKSPDLILLDLRLPGMGGLDVCRKLRSQGAKASIVMLTSKSSELDRVLGLEVGADDYIVKPFSVMEVMARVRAQLRRLDMGKTSSEEMEVIVAGQLVIDIKKREVLLEQQSLELTAKEFDLLVFFATHPGHVYSRTQLLDQVWGYGYAGYEHTVNSHINRLRAKIQSDQQATQYINTVWGVGYKFIQPA